MKYTTIKEREQSKKEALSFLDKLFEDINSNKPYSEKKYLQEFDKMYKKNEQKKNCINKNCINKNCNGSNFFSNNINSNNVYISDLGTSGYNSYCCTSPF